MLQCVCVCVCVWVVLGLSIARHAELKSISHRYKRLIVAPQRSQESRRR